MDRSGARSGAMPAGSVGRRAARSAGVGKRDDPVCDARGAPPGECRGGRSTVRCARHRRSGRRGRRAGAPQELRQRLRPRRLHRRGGRDARPPSDRPGGDGRLRHDPRPGGARRIRRAASSTPIPRCCRRFRAGMPSRTRWPTASRSPAARFTSRPSKWTPDRSWPRRRCRSDRGRHRRVAARADQDRRTPALSGHHPPDPGARFGAVRAFLSVYDKSGVVELADRARRPRMGPRVEWWNRVCAA